MVQVTNWKRDRVCLFEDEDREVFFLHIVSHAWDPTSNTTHYYSHSFYFFPKKSNSNLDCVIENPHIIIILDNLIELLLLLKCFF